jgi:hypothetical protein
MPTETITISNMTKEHLADRSNETKLALERIGEGCRIVLAVDVSGKKQPLRLSDVGAFEVRALIETDMRNHLKEMEIEIAYRREQMK